VSATLAIESKIDEIHEDFEANVIGHKVDRDIMLLVDLAFHSALSFKFQGRLVQKGCVEILIVGDTRTGKSETSKCLIRHYLRGELIDCGNATVAGLFGGVDEVSGKNRFVRAGKLPLRNSELVVLDESNDLPPELIGKLSGVRSSGIYQVVKIVQASIPCRLRLVWIANPRSGDPIAEKNYGVLAIPEVIDKPEDVARFDAAVVISANDVDVDALYVTSTTRKRVPHRYTGERCRSLIDWVWSRSANQIVISPDTEEAILDWSKDFSDKYSGKIPLVVRTEQRIKIARLSVALAARLGSTEEPDCEKIIVRPEHVHYVCRRIQAIYDRNSMGYDGFSRSVDPRKLGPYVDKVLRALGKEGAGALLRMRFVSKSILTDLFSDKDAGNKAWNLLLRSHGVENRTGRGYSMTEPMITRLKADISKLPQNPSASPLNEVD
jgi:hypothetical protein